MKESVFDVLMYLFENYMNDETELDQDRDTLHGELLQAGFEQGEIVRAFDWLEGLAKLQDAPAEGTLQRPQSMRIFSDEEAEKIDCDSRGFLLFLEQMGVLDHTTRETVIDRVMALDSLEVNLEQVKWVILMVLFNQPGHEAALAWMEDLVLDEMAASLH